MLETTKSITINNEVFKFKLNGNKFYTTSLEIAKRFGKEHYNIIRTIESDKELLEDFINHLKIELVEYMDKKGEARKMYLLDRDSFSFYVMGFTGKEAKRWKLAYIKAFNKMESMLRDHEPRLENKEDIEKAILLEQLERAREERKRLQAERERTEADFVISLSKKIEKEFNVNGVETVKKVESFLKDEGLNKYTKLLPSYTANKYVGTIGEVSERVSHAYSYFYKDNANYPEIKLSAIKFNKLALTSGYYDLKTRNSSSGKIKKFYVLKDKYLKYGKNIVSKQNSNQTQIHLYDDSIKEFYQLVTTNN